MPALSKARDSAYKVSCLSNVKQMGYGVGVFANNCDGVVPTFAGTPTTWLGYNEDDENFDTSDQLWYSWIGLLQPYITGKPLDIKKGYDSKLWICASDKVSPVESETVYNRVVSRNCISYGITASLYTAPTYPAGDNTGNGTWKDGTRLYDVKQPAMRMYLSEHGKKFPAPPNGNNAEIWRTPCVSWGYPTYEKYISTNRLFGAPGIYHGGKNPVSSTLFADFHAKAIAFDQIADPKHSNPCNPAGIDLWYYNKWSLVSRIPGLSLDKDPTGRYP